MLQRLRGRRGLNWLGRCAARYALTQLSALARRPLCGPTLATLITNYDCNLRCHMCRMAEVGAARNPTASAPLNTADMLGLLQDLSDLGAMGIGFTGGEPLLRRDLAQLLHHAASLGLITHLNTNGTLLTEQVAEEIISTGLQSLNISLDGATASTHDAVRRVPGAFDRAVAAFHAVAAVRKRQAGGPRVKMVSVLSEANAGEVEGITRLAAELGADCVEFIPEQPFASPTAADPNATKKLAPQARKEIERAVRTLMELKEKTVLIENSWRMLRLFAPSFEGKPSPLNCHAALNSITVDAYGDVYPCLPRVNWQPPLANLLTSSLYDIWYRQDLWARRKDTLACRDCYLNCHTELNLLFQPCRRIPETVPFDAGP
ncbi:MAG: radical SAM protein [Deferrisomatales bacterium]|nr:radical SAM protein [Deferrisomatales bacterium]